ELTKGRVAKILQERNRALRREAAEKMAAGYRIHQHTLASLHAAAVRKDAFYARMRGHASARDAALFEANIPTSVYDALIDAVHETVNKRSGGYNIGPYGAPPYILLNWAGTRQDMFTLAHEAGHAMHGYYSNAAQPYPTAQYTIFVAEVASTVNETLLTWHLLDRATSDA